MTKTNQQIVREFIEQVYNNKQVERITEYISEKFIAHNPPYVGMGVFADDSSGERLIVQRIASGSPADGRLQVGDVILRAEDETGAWDTFDQLREFIWGLGRMGTWLNLTVQRGGQLRKITLTRNLIPSFEIPFAYLHASFRNYFLNDWPDIHTEINLLVEQGELVAYFVTLSGTSAQYGRSAVWSESGVYRVKDGKIVEGWAVEDGLSRIKQLGFQVIAPQEVLNPA